jgi:quercetin dioxygenase-like cupin family protein
MGIEDLPMTREVVLEIGLAGLPVDRVEVRRIVMAANLAPGAHVHNGPVFGSIVAGSVLFQVEGGAETVLRAGDVFYEPADVRIEHFDAQADGVTFLGYFPLTAGQQPDLTLVDD